jgi:hypothetical protein
MPVPEAAVDKDYDPVSNKNNVGTTGKLAAMQAETESHPMQNGSDNSFRTRVAVLDTRHVPTAVLWRNLVGHEVREQEDLLCGAYHSHV